MEISCNTKYCYDSTTTHEYINFLGFDHKVSKPLKTETYDNVLLIPDYRGLFDDFRGGAFDVKKGPIQISFQRGGLLTANELINSYDSDINSENLLMDEEVVFLGQYKNHWGHFLVDCISRLWFALENPKKYKFVYLITRPDLGGIHPNAWKFLNALGISKEQVIMIERPVYAKRVIFPEMSYIPYSETIYTEDGNFLPRYHQEFLKTVYKVVDNVSYPNIPSHDKVYFSRSKFAADSKTDFGESLIVDLLKENGFYIVYPEEHSLEEQIFYVNTCKTFATIGGSCAHNIIFSKTRPNMILFNRMNGYQWHQWMMNEMSGVSPITYVDMYCEPFKKFFYTPVSGSFLYMINDNVKLFCIDNNWIIPEKVLQRSTTAKIYLRYTLRVLRVIIGKMYHKVFK